MHQVLFPPRPAGRMLSTAIPTYEKSRKWIAQRKFNGTRTLVHIHGDHICFQSRYGDGHKQFKETPALVREFRSLDIKSDLEYWFDGEILDAKTTNPNYKRKVVLFDILQEGEYFFDSPNLLERYEILRRICRFPIEKEPGYGIALKVTDNIWLAENFSDNLKHHFEEFIDKDEIEGLVLKKKDSVIDNIGTKYYETHWQIRCRKPQKNYKF
jgi:ATP-dependent DNA ligase